MARPVITIAMANGDKIKAELFSDLVPTSVEYFLSYVKTGYYDGLPIHTCLKDQYIQCGYWESSGYGAPAFVGDQDEIKLENNLKNQEGTFAFVTSKYPNTAKLQFAILLTEKPIYNEGFEVVFSPLGKVIEGLAIIKNLSAVPVDEELYPIIPRLVQKITIEDYQSA